MKKVDAREVGPCLNDNCFLGLYVDVALVSSSDGPQTVRAAPNIATKQQTKTTKHHAFKRQKIQQNKYANC